MPTRPAAAPVNRGERRRVLSQNFLVDRRVIEDLVAGSGVSPGDLVLDVGAGNRQITGALARRGARVIAVERDVLTMPLPGEPFQVVANIPFGITTKILRHLLDDPAALVRRADLITQAEVARKRGAGGRGTLLNTCPVRGMCSRSNRRASRDHTRGRP